MSSRDLTDEELMLRVQAGDAASYQTLFDRHNRAIYGFLLRSVGQPEQAAELFQETWLKVHRARQTWNAAQRFRPWLFGIAANTRRDAARRQGRQVSTVELTDAPTSSRPELRLTVEQAIAALPEPLREAFLLGAVHGFDHNEVAQQLDISPDNARARISRARAALRQALGTEES